MATPIIQSIPAQINNICYVTTGTTVTYYIDSNITNGASYQWYLNDVLVSIGTGYTLSNASLNDKVYVKEFISIEQYNNYRVVGNTEEPNENNVGTPRYRKIGTNSSVCEMVMQTGISTYEWITIKTNTW